MEVKRHEVSSGGLLFEKVEVIWRIENFDVIRKSDELLDGQYVEFQAGNSIGLASDWTLYLPEYREPLRTEGTKRKWIGVFFSLDQVPEGVEELMASYSIKIKRKGGGDGEDVFFSGDSECALNFVHPTGCKCGCGGGPKCSGEWGEKYVIPQNAKVESLPLIDGCLVIEAALTLMKLEGNPTQESREKIEARFKTKFTEKLVQDLAKLLGGEELEEVKGGDTKIVAKDEVEFAVNRGILSARSPVFEKMFKTPMTENQTGRVVITDLSSKTVAVLLRYIYTGTMHQDWSEEQVLLELVYAAVKYQLQDLTDFLDQIVGCVCTKENAGRLFSLLGKVGMKTGEREVFRFIKGKLTSFEDMASFVEEGTREPDILPTVIIPANQKECFVKQMKLDDAES